MGRLYAIETDIADTLKVIEESKTDRSENVGWSTDYVLEIMDNEKWLVGEIARLREALTFYSNEKHYQDYDEWSPGTSDVMSDHGRKAKSALEETK